MSNLARKYPIKLLSSKITWLCHINPIELYLFVTSIYHESRSLFQTNGITHRTRALSQEFSCRTRFARFVNEEVPKQQTRATQARICPRGKMVLPFLTFSSRFGICFLLSLREYHPRPTYRPSHLLRWNRNPLFCDTRFLFFEYLPHPTHPLGP